MKHCAWLAASIFLSVLLAGCSIVIHTPGADTALSPSAQPGSQETVSSAPPSSGDPGSSVQAENSQDSIQDGVQDSIQDSVQDGEISSEEALALALENAGVPEDDVRGVKTERDRENDIPVYQVEFETRYGDYDFSIAVSDGRIVDADYEVDEEWLDTLGGSPVTLEEAKEIVRQKVPGSDAADIQIREEGGGRGRYEGELFHDGMKYEFEIDPQTGIILDWNADMRE